MPAFNLKNTYATGQTPSEKDIDRIRNTVLNFFNNTKLDGDNIDLSDVATNFTAAQTNSLLGNLSIGSTLSEENASRVTSSTDEKVTLTIAEDGNYIVSAEGFAGMTQGMETSSNPTTIQYYITKNGLATSVTRTAKLDYIITTDPTGSDIITMAHPIHMVETVSLNAGDELGVFIDNATVEATSIRINAIKIGS